MFYPPSTIHYPLGVPVKRESRNQASAGMTCPWEPLVAEDAVTELLIMERLPAPVTFDSDDRSLYKPSAIAALLKDRD